MSPSTSRPRSAIRVHDTAARALVGIEPRDEGRIAMYVCGPTVYNYIHIGNARTFVWFDLIRRYLRYRGYEVTYVMNYTDVDDKIIERANLEGIQVDAVTNKYSRAFEDDLAALGAERADVVVKATDHVDDMVRRSRGWSRRAARTRPTATCSFPSSPSRPMESCRTGP
ncbi:MAG: class I tRNA ligase family protein [Actinomycetota bacterium]|nr:class I tRNA ligase family protein [Actinomycetota bacterium]